jgi:hypothetical protein
MERFSAERTRRCFYGVTFTEYGILISLVAVVGMVGLQAMGHSADHLFQGASRTLESGGTLSLLNANGSGGSTGSATGNMGTLSGKQLANGSARYQIVTDPVTGQPNLKLVGGDTSTGTNVSSSEGMQETLGSMMVAEQLQAMADAQTDPAAKDYYTQLATWTYYLGGTEGVMDNVKGLTIDEVFKGNKAYTRQNALTDMQTYQETIADLLTNPPPGVSAQTISMVTPLVNSSLEIAQTYLDANSSFIDKKGKVKEQVNNTTTPNGNNGNGLALGVGKPKKLKSIKGTYDQLVAITEMRTTAQQVLTDNIVESAPVETTLDNAATVDPLASTTPAP